MIITYPNGTIIELSLEELIGLISVFNRNSLSVDSQEVKPSISSSDKGSITAEDEKVRCRSAISDSSAADIPMTHKELVLKVQNDLNNKFHHGMRGKRGRPRKVYKMVDDERPTDD